LKVYICTACDQTVPLKQLAKHRETCTTELALAKGGKGQSVSGQIFRIVLAIALVAGGIGLGFYSFASVGQMRQMERIPATSVHAVLPGEVNLSGEARKLKDLLKGPKSGSKCFYYRYLVEKEVRDSDGDRSWRTVKDERKRTDFLLKDESGSIPLRLAGEVDFSLPESFQTRSGDYRYTEWRIDPGNEVSLFGAIVDKNGGYEVRFDVQGDYEPIVSKYGELSERSDKASASVLACWGGLVLLAFAIGFAVRACGVHRLLVFFAILSVVIMLSLTIQGVIMIVSDLNAGVSRLDRHSESAAEVIGASLAAAGHNWDGKWESLGDVDKYGKLDEKAQARLRRIRLDLAMATDRVQAQRATFPENVVAALSAVPRRADLALPDTDKAELRAMSREFQKARLSGLMAFGMIGGSLIIGIPCFFAGFRNVRNKRCIENVPTSKTAGAVFGLGEFKGIVEPAEAAVPLSGPLTHSPCTYYTYKVEERRRSGKKTKWVTITDRSDRCAFACRDGEGAIEVAPDGAEIMTCHKTVQRRGRMRYTETRLEINDPVYVIGHCAIHPDQADLLHVCKPEDKLPFIISNLTEKAVMGRVAGRGVAQLNMAFAGVLLIGLTVFGLFGSFGADDYLTSAMLAPVFMLFLTLVLHFNDLVFLRQRVNRNASNIDVSLKKRADLLPNFVELVKGYMAHEQEVMQAVTEMRSTYKARDLKNPDSIGDYLQAEQRATHKFLARMESYPDLKANRDASMLMRLLVSLENEIALMREGYNHAVEVYNTRVSTMPDMIFAKVFGFKERDFILVDEESYQVPSLTDSFGAGETLAATISEDELDALVTVYSLLLNPEADVRTMQLTTIGERHDTAIAGKVEEMVAEVDAAGLNDLDRLKRAEACYDALAELTDADYRTFGIVVRELMEAEGIISLFESALQYSMGARLDAKREGREEPSVWYESLELVAEPIAKVLSALVYEEDDVEATAVGAFQKGRDALDYAGDTAIEMLPKDACGIPAFNLALVDLGRCNRALRKRIYLACEACVADNDDFTVEQALLMAMIADGLGLARPEWAGG
jgi:hypothetical protein